MASRLDLQTLLESTLGSGNVYYQAPSNVSMQYPAIRYSRKNIDNKFADDVVYMQTLEYELTVIDEDPDSAVVMNVSKLPMCKFDRHYASNNLNHDVFIIKF